jgi:hypothetical protein
MSGYGQSIGYANQAKVATIRSARRIRKEKKMKLGLKQRLRNWLMNEELEQDVPQLVESDRLSSEGMRMQIYKASGGYVVETRTYDHHKDRNFNTMHVIREDQDLGDALGKIVMMEALKR